MLSHSDKSMNTIIHIGYLQQGRHRSYLFLRQTEGGHYVWEREDNKEVSTQEAFPIVMAESIEEAIRLARLQWVNPSWNSLGCGFRFTLPERDEIGTPALFHQMVLSHQVSNGVYLDKELGCLCIVRDTPSETLLLWKQLEQKDSLHRV